MRWHAPWFQSLLQRRCLHWRPGSPQGWDLHPCGSQSGSGTPTVQCCSPAAGLSAESQLPARRLSAGAPVLPHDKNNGGGDEAEDEFVRFHVLFQSVGQMVMVGQTTLEWMSE